MLLPIFHKVSCLAIATGTAATGPRRTGQLLFTVGLALLGYTATAQNAPTPASIPTGDKVLYGRHASYSKSNQAQQLAQGSYLSPHELRLKRHQYVN
jgi:hypothetical protein